MSGISRGVMLRRMALACLLTTAATAGGQPAYPARPVQVLIGFPAGGSVDVMARNYIAALSTVLNQQFVIVNRDGASGTIAFAALANARPDGYTLGAGPTTPITNAPHLMTGIKYSLDSFEYVCQVFENVFTIGVPQNSPLRNLQDLIAAARANPGKLSYAHSGVGTVPHLAIAAFALRVGIQVNAVAYRGEAPLLPDLIAGRVDFGGPAIASLAGRDQIRALGVFADYRHPQFPDVPSLAEMGIPTLPPGLNGLYAPKGTPPEILQTLERGCEAATKADAFRNAAQKLYQPVVFLDRAAFAKRAAEDYRIKADLVRTLNISAQ
jgi:tripartite-type tricarboxylate transporter receptor subunit TctC